MRKYDTIRCANKEEVKQYLRELNRTGHHAVVGGGNGLIITITKEGGTDGKNTN